jgi:hypothetical protein
LQEEYNIMEARIIAVKIEPTVGVYDDAGRMVNSQALPAAVIFEARLPEVFTAQQLAEFARACNAPEKPEPSDDPSS